MKTRPFIAILALGGALTVGYFWVNSPQKVAPMTPVIKETAAHEPPLTASSSAPEREATVEETAPAQPPALTSNQIQKAIHENLTKEDRLIEKYHKILFDDFLKRGKLTRDEENKAVDLDVPPDPVRAQELRLAFFSEIEAQVGTKWSDALLSSQKRMELLNNSLEHFGDRHTRFRFHVEEGYPGGPKVVIVAMDYGTHRGQGTMAIDRFPVAYGDLGKAVMDNMP